MNILKWFEYLPEDLWNVMVCYAHEQDLENKECNSLYEAVWSLSWQEANDNRLVEVYRFANMGISKKYRLISEEDWELLEEAKEKKDKEREFVAKFTPIGTPDVISKPFKTTKEKNVDKIFREMGKPIKSKK